MNRGSIIYIRVGVPRDVMRFAPPYHHMRAIADDLRNAGRYPKQDDYGITRIILLGNLTGLSVNADNHEGGRYSLSSHSPQHTMCEIWAGNPKCPEYFDSDDEVT